jgi:hypothetical protein
MLGVRRHEEKCRKTKDSGIYILGSIGKQNAIIPHAGRYLFGIMLSRHESEKY